MEQRLKNRVEAFLRALAASLRRELPDGPLVRMSFLSTAAAALAAHGFLFANEFFSHDGLIGMYYRNVDSRYYASLGRFLIPFYERWKGTAAAPWLIGVLFLLWTALAACLVIRLLDIRSRMGQAFTCALLCTNLSLTLTGATYVYCMDEYAFALLAAALAAWAFVRGGWYVLPGVLSLAVSLAVYQSYFTVAAALCLLAVLRRTAGSWSALSNLRTGLRCLAALAAGFGVYYVWWTAVRISLHVGKQRLEESLLSKGLSGLAGLVWGANRRYLTYLTEPMGVLGRLMPAVHAVLLLLLAWRLACVLLDRRTSWGNRALAVLCAALLPTAFHSAYILIPVDTHALVLYARELLYLLPVLALGPCVPEGAGEESGVLGRLLGRDLPSWGRAALAGTLCLVLWHHVVFANQAYMKKELEKNATLALVVRMVDRIEAVDGYVPGETPVTFAGMLPANPALNQPREAFQELSKWAGLWNSYAATYTMGQYLTNYLHYPLLWDRTADCASWPEVQAMPAFPAADSVRMVDGVVVVKLSG